jgi:acetylglutamate kinase
LFTALLITFDAAKLLNTQDMEKLTIVKVGGKIVEEAASLNALLDRFARIEGRKLLVHGGGRSATALAARLGIETKMIDGRRVTDAEMLEVVTMVYGGLVNKNIVAALQARGINALGLTGADINLIRSHRRPLKNGIDYGFVGDVDCVNAPLLADLIAKEVVPVLAPLTHDGAGSLLNTNADTIAAETAKALASYFDVTLVYCFEKKGVLLNADDDESVIPTVDRARFAQLVGDGIVAGGMIPKLENALQAVDAGVREVVITADSEIDNPQAGTHVVGTQA